VVERLDKSRFSLLYSSFDEALDYLSSVNANVIHAPSIDLKWNESGGFAGRDTFVRFPLAILSFMKQVGFERNHLKHFEPNLVASDSRLSTIIAAKTIGYPVVTILNQFKILFPPRFRRNALSRLYEGIEGSVLGILWALSDEILVPDLPPPYTIGEANVSGTGVSKRANFIGFMSPRASISNERIEKVKRILEFDSRPIVFLQISGPTLTKTQFTRVCLDSMDALYQKFNAVLSLGIPGGSIEPQKTLSGGRIYEWCPLKDEIFEMCSLMVARSGHTTIGQCVDNGKPAVLAPIYNHSEQIWNAEKFQRLGLGKEIRAENLSESTLVEGIDQCIADKGYQEKALELKAISRKFDGVSSAIEAINSLLRRSVQKEN
jgi:UDP-N-acetylglucosamine--N-acetylmuramyl-(pentapeptide) pyrophosphoryl-undecaprenol N-acetylglucosamine transferase